MKYFAEINSSNIVLRVCVFSDSITDADAAKQEVPLSADGVKWVETFLDGGSRKNYAGIGYTYDSVKDCFIAPNPLIGNYYAFGNPSDSYTLNPITCKWEEPAGKPEGYCFWKDDTLSWEKDEDAIKAFLEETT